MLFLGCDSGSTKAAFMLVDERGHVLAAQRFPGVSIVANGLEEYRTCMRDNIHSVLQTAGKKAKDVTSAAFGLTGYGESRTAAQDMRKTFERVLDGVPCILVNDSVTCWCGALKGEPGICIASGTGSVAYGEDESGAGARAGGWSIRFADEGSAYWIAVQALRAFFHQADGRMEKTALYGHILSLFGVEDPLHACGEIEAITEHGNYARVAQLQKEVLTLCKQGDPCARSIYEEAARSLCDLAKAIKGRLDFHGRVRMTYTGGLFNVGSYIVEPLRQCVEEIGGVLIEPSFGPLSGAVGYAARGIVPRSTLEYIMREADDWARANGM